jgi:hypothetical protein
LPESLSDLQDQIASFLGKQESSSHSWVPAFAGTTSAENKIDTENARYSQLSLLLVSSPNGHYF